MILWQKIGLKAFALLASCWFLTSCVSSNSETYTPPKKTIKDLSMQEKEDSSSLRKRIMILPFLDSEQTRSQAMRDSARDQFILELNKTGEVIAVDSQDLKMDFSSQIKSGQYQLDEIAKVSRNLGVAALLEGQVVDLKVKKKGDQVGVFRQVKSIFEAQVRVRIVSARSGKELFNTLKTISIEESQVRVAESVSSDRFFQNNPELMENLVTEAFLDFTPQIIATMEKMSWEGRIAAFSGDRIFLNVGKISGIQIGDILKVSDEGDEIFDPQSGNYIGKVPGRLKGTLEVISYFGQDGSIAIVHSGAGFKDNDRVEMY